MRFIKTFFKAPKFTPVSWYLATTIIILLYVFMEWLFITTQPSFLSALKFHERVFILLNAAALLSLVCLLVFLPYLILNKILKGKIPRRVLRHVVAAIPAFVFTTMLLLMVDNITYNAWEVGVITSRGVSRWVYAVGFVVVFIFSLNRMMRFTDGIDSSLRKSLPQKRRLLIIVVIALVVIISLLPVAANPNQSLLQTMNPSRKGLTPKPNIILVTADSLNAEKMSVYGFEHATTPFLEQLANSSLVAENHFSNAQGTIGSLSSLLTGRYPADTRMLADEDILRDEEAFEHLPLILKRYGYKTAQLSFSYYADAGNLNLQGGFDLANNEESSANPIVIAAAVALPTDYYYFLREVLVRASDRLAHIFFIKTMENPFKQMTESSEEFNDAYKLETVISLLETSSQPLFIHLHWMGTHGPKYYPDVQVFSSGKDVALQGNREEDFYLDSILEFDQGMKRLYEELVKTGKYQNTILIISSDHSQRWSISRLPLIIRFPYGWYHKQLKGNTESLDIAPTILAYLGQTQPEWMEGQSLLSGRDAKRPVFIAQIGEANKDPETGKISYPDPTEPFYQFGRMTVVVCDTWYTVNLKTLKMTTGRVKAYSGNCGPEPGALHALNLIKAHLETYGFDTFSLYRVTLPK